MTATTEILQYAGGGGANVLSQTAYAALTSILANGMSSGIVPSNQMNKILRQSSFMAAGLAAFCVAQGVSVPDDGNLANLVSEITAAVRNVSDGRTLLAGNVTYYVSSTGNDTTGNGTSGAPWLTLQKAINYVLGMCDFGGYTVTIQLGNGSFAGAAWSLPIVGGGAANLIINGNSGSPSSVIITSGLYASGAGVGAMVQNLEMSNSVSGAACILADQAANVYLGNNIIFASTVSGYHLEASRDGRLLMTGSYTISGSAVSHIELAEGGSIYYAGALTVTATGTPAFTTFISASDVSKAYIPVSLVTFSGAATGARYLSALNSVINTVGGGATYLLGNAGGTATTGQYA